MYKTKYKAGDLAIVKKDLQSYMHYGILFAVPHMLNKCGKVVEIERVMEASVVGHYYLLKGSESGWTDEMLDDITNED